MKTFMNILLGLLFTAALCLLALQGFVLPDLGVWIDLLLRIAAALFIQILMLRVGKNNWIKMLPLFVTSVLAVWGFFLLLTSPSWRNATVTGFTMDYVSPAVTCAVVCIIPRILPGIRAQLRKFLKKRKRKPKNKPAAKKAK